MYVLKIIHYQNYVNHIQHHPGQETVETVSKLTIFSKKEQEIVNLETWFRFLFFLVK